MNYKEIKELLKKRRIVYKEFQFEGHSLGRIENAFPKAGKDYHTVRYGWLVSFYLGGKVVAEDGKKWVRVTEIFRKGDAATPAFYSAIYIHARDLRDLIAEGLVEPFCWDFPRYEVQHYHPDIRGEKLYRIVPTSFEPRYITGEDYVLHKDYIGWFSDIFFFGTSTSIRELVSRIEKYENARGNKYKIIY